jgi:hypothetical protein
MKLAALLPQNVNVGHRLVEKALTKKEIGNLIDTVYRHCGQKATVIFADQIMGLGFKEAAKAGISFGKDDIVIPESKAMHINSSLNEVKQFEPLKAFLLFILNECGKDIINGRIVNKLLEPETKSESKTTSSSISNNDDDEDTVKIPPEICKEISSTAYGKYSKFIPYLRANGVYDETTYNAFRNSSNDNEWIPILGDIRKRYKKFCFQELSAKENAGYYETLEECDGDYEAIKQDTILELGGMVKVKKMLKSTFERKLEENINARDSKIPSNKYLFYYDASKKNDD